jgi:hypothetical protein
MAGYSQAIYALDSPHRFKADAAEVAPLAVWLLPNFLAVVFAVTLLQVLFLSAGMPRLFHDSDTGWHVRNGETILKTAAAPRADSFSYTREGGAWLSWEWLSDALFGISHRLAGLSGVAFVAAAAIAFTVCTAARLALSLGGNLFLTASGSVLLLGVTSMHWLARPHVFSWIFALIFLSVAEQERHQPNRAIWILPLAAAFWANMHASFLLGPVILFIYALGECFAGIGGFKSSHGARRFAFASLLCVLATFINPYGWRLHEHILTYLQSNYLMDHIEEFRSFSFHSAGAMYVELFLAVAVVGTVALIKQRAYGPALLSLGMLHMSLYSARHLPIAAVLLLPLSIAAVSREARRWERLTGFVKYSDRLCAIDKRIYGIVPIAIVLVLTLLGINALAINGYAGFDSGTFPVHAADFLDNKVGRVFTTDQWAGYLIYRFAGRLKIFVDGRSDFYGQDLLEAYARVVAVKPGWDHVLNQYGVRFVLVQPDSPLAAALQFRTDWKRVYSDPVGSIYERVS